MDPSTELWVDLLFPLAVLLVTYLIGSAIEARHYKRIREREGALRHLPAVSFRTVPGGWEVLESALVTGGVVISVDYFKRFLASLRNLVGGRVKSYESLLDRGRREALLRMKEEALARGCSAVVNVRLETTRLANSRRGGKGTTGLEVIAYGTGLRLRDDPA